MSQAKKSTQPVIKTAPLVKPAKKFPEVGDTVIGLFRQYVDETGALVRTKSGKVNSTVALVYSSTKIGLPSGDVFNVMYQGNRIYKAIS